MSRKSFMEKTKYLVWISFLVIILCSCGHETDEQKTNRFAAEKKLIESGIYDEKWIFFSRNQEGGFWFYDSKSIDCKNKKVWTLLVSNKTELGTYSFYLLQFDDSRRYRYLSTREYSSYKLKNSWDFVPRTRIVGERWRIGMFESYEYYDDIDEGYENITPQSIINELYDDIIPRYCSIKRFLPNIANR